MFHELFTERYIVTRSCPVVSLVALDPSTMQEVYVTGAPAAMCPFTASACWIELSPDEQHFAMLWSQDCPAASGSTWLLNLCIYTACTGRQVATF